nr:hypothetical protein MarFTME_108 [Marseillevirus futianmevirus]
MSRKNFYLESIQGGQGKVSSCIKKFTDQQRENSNFIPEDYRCLSLVSSHWAKIKGLCSLEDCSLIRDKAGWVSQHRHFVKTLGHSWDGKNEFFNEETFDERKVFGK